jgi:hypothetical protein
MIIAKFRVKNEAQTLRPGYDYLVAFLEALKPFYPKESWHCLPRSMTERSSGWIPVMNEDKFLRRSAQDMGDAKERYPNLVRGFFSLIANASSEEAYASDGRTVLTFDPSTALVMMQIVEPNLESNDLYRRTEGIFQAACHFLNVEYACCDRSRAPRPNGGPGETHYGIDRRVFPHREFLGWMGFVKGHIEARQIPEADKLILLPEKEGTIIVAVADVFDVHNPDHVEQAQRVEMRLVDLDALPVTDPRFL